MKALSLLLLFAASHNALASDMRYQLIFPDHEVKQYVVTSVIADVPIKDSEHRCAIGYQENSIKGSTIQEVNVACINKKTKQSYGTLMNCIDGVSGAFAFMVINSKGLTYQIKVMCNIPS